MKQAWLAAAAFAVGVAVIGAPGSATAQTKLKFAHVYEVSEPYHAAALWAAGEIAKRTSNRYTMEVFPASSLGKETDINQGLTLGTVDIIYTGQLFAGRNYGPISIGGAPYMFRDFNHWKSFAASKVFDELTDGYQKAASGNKVVAITYYGERHTTANKPLAKPDDMKGLKIRVPDAPLYTMFPRATGANPTPIAFAEVYLALQNKTVEAQENPLPTIEAKKFYEVQTHINLTGHITDALLTIVGGPLWSKLSEPDRKIFIDVFREAAVRATNEIVQNEQKLAGDFSTKYGKTVVKVDRAPFRAAVDKFYQSGKLPDGAALPWPKDVYDKVQAIK